MKRLPPVLRYFGSKWRTAPRYPAPLHDRIIEPFAGGAGYSLLYPEREVILIESNPVVARIWKWLIAARPEEILAIPLLKPGETIGNAPISIQAKNFVGFWNSISPAHPQWKMVPSAARIPASFWNERIRARTAELVEHIRHWRIFCANALDFDYTGKATWFFDPPYQSQAKAYGAALDYKHLGKYCQERRGQVIVCEAGRADWLPFRELGSFHAAPRAQAGGAAARRTHELIWTNT